MTILIDKDDTHIGHLKCNLHYSRQDRVNKPNLLYAVAFKAHPKQQREIHCQRSPSPFGMDKQTHIRPASHPICSKWVIYFPKAVRSRKAISSVSFFFYRSLVVHGNNIILGTRGSRLATRNKNMLHLRGRSPTHSNLIVIVWI